MSIKKKIPLRGKQEPLRASSGGKGTPASPPWTRPNLPASSVRAEIPLTGGTFWKMAYQIKSHNKAKKNENKVR